MLTVPFGVILGLLVSALIALLVPVVAALVAGWRGAPMKAWAVGAATFFLSQVVLRLPWQIAVGVWLQRQHASEATMWAWLALSAFTAGLFEETGRFVAYRFVLKERTPVAALTMGLGHGGLEAMLLVGLPMLVNVMFVMALQLGVGFGLPDETKATVTQQFAQLAPLTALAGGLERLSSMVVHVGLSLLVLRAVTAGGSRWWLAAAIGFHTLSNLVGVGAAKLLGVWQAEGVIAVFALLALWWTLRDLGVLRRAARPEPRFPMTTSTSVKLITALALGVGLVTLPIPFVLLAQPGVPKVVGLATLVTCLVTPAVLGLAVLWAPRAVRLDADALVVERLAWSDLRIPLSDLVRVERGPALKAFGGGVRRVAGNGGLLGFTGLFHVDGVGMVRCWATRLGAPTLLVRRRSEKPVLLGVDDSAALLEALSGRLRA